MRRLNARPLILEESGPRVREGAFAERMEEHPAGSVASREIVSVRGLKVYVALLSRVRLSIAYDRRSRYTARMPGLLGSPPVRETAWLRTRHHGPVVRAPGASPKRSERAR